MNTEDEATPIHKLNIDGDDKWAGRTFRTALNGNALAINNKNENIVLLEINNTGGIGDRLNIDKEEWESIRDHQIFGENGDNVALFTLDGMVITFNFDSELSKAERKAFHHIKFEDHEQAISLAVCPKSKIFACHTQNTVFPYGAYRVIILELKEDNTFIERASINLQQENIGYFQAFEFLDYLDHNLILTGISHDHINSHLINFCFNTDSGVFEELKGLRKDIGVKDVKKLYRIENDGKVGFKAVDRESRMISIEYQF